MGLLSPDYFAHDASCVIRCVMLNIHWTPLVVRGRVFLPLDACLVGISNIAFYGIKRPVHVIVSMQIVYHRLRHHK